MSVSIGSRQPRNTAMISAMQSTMPTPVEMFMSVLVVSISSDCSTGLPVSPTSTPGTCARASSIAARITRSGSSITPRLEKSLRGMTPTKRSRPLSLTRYSATRGSPMNSGAAGAAVATAVSSSTALAPTRSASSRGMKSPSEVSRSRRRCASASRTPGPPSEAMRGRASRPSTSPARSAVGMAHVAIRIWSSKPMRAFTRSIDGSSRRRAATRSTARCASPMRRTPSVPWESTTTHAYSRSPNSFTKRRYSAT